MFDDFYFDYFTHEALDVTVLHQMVCYIGLSVCYVEVVFIICNLTNYIILDKPYKHVSRQNAL